MISYVLFKKLIKINNNKFKNKYKSYSVLYIARWRSIMNIPKLIISFPSNINYIPQNRSQPIISLPSNSIFIHVIDIA